jgi:hypothetical protein
VRVARGTSFGNNHYRFDAQFSISCAKKFIGALKMGRLRFLPAPLLFRVLAQSTLTKDASGACHFMPLSIVKYRDERPMFNPVGRRAPLSFQPPPFLRGIEKSMIRKISDRAKPGSISLDLGEPDLPTPEVIRRECDSA